MYHFVCFCFLFTRTRLHTLMDRLRWFVASPTVQGKLKPRVVLGTPRFQMKAVTGKGGRTVERKRADGEDTEVMVVAGRRSRVATGSALASVSSFAV